jgi:nicotinate-nucleotide adenylyltransferase
MGGTFNPVHLGHLRSAEEVTESLDLDRVLLIPAAQPPHKSERELISFAHRWRMLELAVGGNPRFQLSDLEHRRPGKSYSVETLTQLTDQYGPGTELYFLVGLDAFLELPTWKRYRDLFSLCRFVVVARSGHPLDALHSMLRGKISPGYSFDNQEQAFVHPRLFPVYYRQVTVLDISSSRIRELLSLGRSVRYLLPEQVVHYIYQEKLYQSREEVRGL